MPKPSLTPYKVDREMPRKSPCFCRYDFTDGDLGVSLTQMRMFLDEYADIPIRVLRFLVTEINYGGRVTDDKDRRLINNLVTGFVGQQVLDPDYDFSASGAALDLSPAMQGQLCLSLALCMHACPVSFCIGNWGKQKGTCTYHE